MAQVIVYTTSYCPYCTGAKALLRSKKIKFEEIDVTRDPERREELGELLQGLLRQQRTLVVSTHDEEFARQFATRIVRLKNGVVV